jgi:tRNA(fMet)-specific endonuclease VapC
MSFLLPKDTFCSWLRGNRALHRWFLQNQGKLHVSVVTITEVELWLLQPNTPVRFLQTYQALWNVVTLLNVDDTIARRAASLGSTLRGQGTGLSTVNLLIAATALVHNLTLVIHSPAFSAPVPGLTVVDWMIP